MNFLKRTLYKFGFEQTGSLSVEAVFAFPMLAWAATATYTFFDAYKAQNASYRANYTISDMLSRETVDINIDYLNGLLKVFRYMTYGHEDGSWIRVSVVKCNSNCADQNTRDLEFEWSKGASGARDLEEIDFLHYGDLIPLMPTGDQLILVETSIDYKPPFANSLVSFPERKLVSHVVTRPRFGPQLGWDSEYVSTDDGHDDGSSDPDPDT